MPGEPEFLGLPHTVVPELRLGQTNPPIRFMRLISNTPPVKRLLGRIVGLGFRREHIHSPRLTNHR
jgi:hypothetical protein